MEKTEWNRSDGQEIFNNCKSIISENFIYENFCIGIGMTVLTYGLLRCLVVDHRTKGRESFFNAYRGIIFFNIFFASIVHHNLLEVEEHDLTESSHSMYSLLEAKAKFQLIF